MNDPQPDVHQLQEEILQLKDLLSGPIVFPVEWKLSIGERRFLASLYTSPNGMRTYEALHVAISGIEPNTDVKMVGVYMCHIRKKLKGTGVVIEVVWGVGYRLTKEGRGRLARHIQDLVHLPQKLGIENEISTLITSARHALEGCIHKLDELEQRVISSKTGV